MVSADFKRKGSFSEIVLPHMLARALKERFTGMFRAERESIIKVIYFRDGEIAFASSNQPSDRLGEVLIKRGQLSREQLDMAMSKLEANVSLGKMLVELGYLSPKELLEGAKTQVEEILFSLNTWGEGSFEFIEGPLPQRIVDLKLNTRQVIYQGIMQLDDRRWVLEQIGSMESVFATQPELNEVADSLKLDADAQQVVANINGQHTVRDLSSRSRLDDFSVGKILAALVCLGLVEQTEHEAGAAGAGEYLAPREEAEEAEETLVGEEGEAQATAPISGVFGGEEPESDVTTTRPLGVFADEDEEEAEAGGGDYEGEEPYEAEDEDELLALDDDGGSRKGLFTTIAGVAVIGVLIVAGWMWWQGRGEPEPEPGEVATVTPPQTALTPPPLDTGGAPLTPPPMATPETTPGDTGQQAAATPPPLTTPSATPETATPTPTALAQVTPPPARTPPPVVAATPPPARTPTPRPVPTPQAIPTPRSTATGVGFGDESRASQGREQLAAGNYRQAATSFQSAIARARGYSLQLEIVCQESSIREAMGHVSSAPEYYVVPFKYRGRDCYKGLWGVYPSRAAAERAFASVPAFFRRQTGGRAYVVPMSAARRTR